VSLAGAAAGKVAPGTLFAAGRASFGRLALAPGFAGMNSLLIPIF
jgi:hypothetical protein